MADWIPDVSKRIVLRGDDVSWDEAEDGRVTLRRRKFGRVGTGVLKTFRVPPDLTVHLDAVGSEAWRLMDGRRTVGEVLQGLQVRFPDEENLGERLGKYLGTLVSNGLVRLE